MTKNLFLFEETYHIAFLNDFALFDSIDNLAAVVGIDKFESVGGCLYGTDKVALFEHLAVFGFERNVFEVEFLHHHTGSGSVDWFCIRVAFDSHFR